MAILLEIFIGILPSTITIQNVNLSYLEFIERYLSKNSPSYQNIITSPCDN